MIFYKKTIYTFLGDKFMFVTISSTFQPHETIYNRQGPKQKVIQHWNFARPIFQAS